MIDEIQQQVANYHRWLKDNTLLHTVGEGWIEITTPFLDRHNDCLQIYVKRDGDAFVLMDDGYTLSDLDISGFQLNNSPKRKDLLRMTLNGFGVEQEEEILMIRTDARNFPRRKHNLIQAMLAVNDLFYLATPLVAGIFLEDVGEWLRTHEIRAVDRVKFTGKSGFDHQFDFAIPPSSVQPERLVKAINNPNRESAQNIMYAWEDTREERSSESQLFAFLNDREKEGGVSTVLTDALRNYGIFPVPWSQRETVRERLAA